MEISFNYVRTYVRTFIHVCIIEIQSLWISKEGAYIYWYIDVKVITIFLLIKYRIQLQLNHAQIKLLIET